MDNIGGMRGKYKWGVMIVERGMEWGKGEEGKGEVGGMMGEGGMEREGKWGGVFYWEAECKGSG